MSNLKQSSPKEFSGNLFAGITPAIVPIETVSTPVMTAAKLSRKRKADIYEADTKDWKEITLDDGRKFLKPPHILDPNEPYIGKSQAGVRKGLLTRYWNLRREHHLGKDANSPKADQQEANGQDNTRNYTQTMQDTVTAENVKLQKDNKLLRKTNQTLEGQIEDLKAEIQNLQESLRQTHHQRTNTTAQPDIPPSKEVHQNRYKSRPYFSKTTSSKTLTHEAESVFFNILIMQRGLRAEMWKIRQETQGLEQEYAGRKEQLAEVLELEKRIKENKDLWSDMDEYMVRMSGNAQRVKDAVVMQGEADEGFEEVRFRV